MRTLGDKHQRFYFLCPEIPFSFCVTLLMNLMFIIFLPALLLLIPFFWLLYGTLIHLPCQCMRSRNNCCTNLLIWLLFFLVVMPIGLALGMAAAAIGAALLIIPLYYYSFTFLVWLLYIGCKTKL